MTDYWVSTQKHFCEICKVYISGHSRSILMHNMSKKHVETEKLMLREADKKQKQKKKDDEE